jgi:hypothetical protein
LLKDFQVNAKNANFQIYAWSKGIHNEDSKPINLTMHKFENWHFLHSLENP